MTLAKDMTIMNRIKEYIEIKEYGEPILLTDVVREFADKNEDIKKIRNTISAYLNRLTKNTELKKFDDGIFYRVKSNPFGETPIDFADLINSIYIYDKEGKNRIGYRIGATVLANIGISNNLESNLEIVTNSFNKRKVIENLKLSIHLKKPVLEVNNDNYIYLQLLDTIKDVDKYHLTGEQTGRKLVKYMEKNDIRIDKLFGFAKDYYNKKTIDNLVELLAR